MQASSRSSILGAILHRASLRVTGRLLQRRDRRVNVETRQEHLHYVPVVVMEVVNRGDRPAVVKQVLVLRNKKVIKDLKVPGAGWVIAPKAEPTPVHLDGNLLREAPTRVMLIDTDGHRWDLKPKDLQRMVREFPQVADAIDQNNSISAYSHTPLPTGGD